MSSRAASLAEDFETMASQMINRARELDDEQWSLPCEEEGRNVGQVIGHMTDVFRVMEDRVGGFLAGKNIERLNTEWVNSRNAERAALNATRSRQEMIEDLKAAAAESAEFLRSLREEQLDVSGVFYEGFDAWSVEETVRFVVIAHGQTHLADVEKSLLPRLADRRG